MNAKSPNEINSADIYAHELSKVKILDAKTEMVHFKKYKKTGDQAAKTALVESCLRFVVKAAKSYSRDPEQQKSLISAGNEGLLVALDRYDPTKGTRFLSYAAWYILLYIREELHKSSVVTIQLGRKKALRKLNKTAEEKRKKLGREATVKELSKATGMSSKQIEKLRQDHFEVTSIDNEPSLTDGTTDIETRTINQSGNELLAFLISSLPVRERFILSGYFGLITEPALSLKQIAAVLGISSERVRQIKLRVLASMKRYLEYNGIGSVDDIYTAS